MGRHKALPALALLALTACASSPAALDPGGAALRRFDEVCRFLPPGMSSYWFSDCTVGKAIDSTDGQHLIARAASDFQSPPGIPGMGTETSVEVYDYGPGRHGLPEDDRRRLWVAEPPIGRDLVWRTRLEGFEQAFWLAFVDDRYQVSTTSRPLLEQALARSTTRQQLLAFVPDLSVLDPATGELIFCRPRPQPTTAFAGPSPTAIMIVQVHTTKPRIEIFATERQPGIEDYYANRRDPILGETVVRDGYHVFHLTFAKQGHWPLLLMLLYGQHLAI